MELARECRVGKSTPPSLGEAMTCVPLVAALSLVLFLARLLARRGGDSVSIAFACVQFHGLRRGPRIYIHRGVLASSLSCVLSVSAYVVISGHIPTRSHALYDQIQISEFTPNPSRSQIVQDRCTHYHYSVLRFAF